MRDLLVCNPVVEFSQFARNGILVQVDVVHLARTIVISAEGVTQLMGDSALKISGIVANVHWKQWLITWIYP